MPALTLPITTPSRAPIGVSAKMMVISQIATTGTNIPSVVPVRALPEPSSSALSSNAVSSFKGWQC